MRRGWLEIRECEVLTKKLVSYFPLRLRPGVQPKLLALQSLYEGKKIIVGRDKLDVVKGVLQKVVYGLFSPVMTVPDLIHL